MAKRGSQDGGDLNLVPIMNLVSILIPFLLMASQFVQLAAVDSTLPAICEGCGDMTTPGEVLDLSLLVSRSGVRITGVAPEVLGEGGDLVSCSGTCRNASDYDWPTLTAALARVKDKHPEHDSLILVPDDSVSYEILVATMDAAREDRQARDADGSPRELFPAVVIAGGTGR